MPQAYSDAIGNRTGVWRWKCISDTGTSPTDCSLQGEAVSILQGNFPPDSGMMRSRSSMKPRRLMILDRGGSRRIVNDRF
jgi:hypothetical protein